MKASIIVLTYNQERYIDDTLKSILNQKGDVPFEIIVSDDCSTDSTPDIIEKYSGMYPNVIKAVYHAENVGVLRNYYSTLSLCSGEYIMGCGGDDCWLPDKLSYQVEYMDSHPETLLHHTRVLIIDKNSQEIGKSKIYPKYSSFRELLIENPVCACTACFRRSAAFDYIESVAPDTRNWQMEDLPMWLWFAQRGTIEYSSQILCAYRVLRDSVSHAANLDKQIAFENSVYDIKRFFTNGNKKYEQMILSKHNASLAHIYRTHGDYDRFRYYSRKAGTLVGFLKAIVPKAFLTQRKVIGV